MSVLAILAFIGVGTVAALAGAREIRRIKGARFKGRELLSAEDFYARFYRDAGLDPLLVEGVRQELATSLEIPAEVLRPTDRFDVELAPARGWEKWWDDGLAVVRTKGLFVLGKVYPVDWPKVQTIDDLIRDMARST